MPKKEQKEKEIEDLPPELKKIFEIIEESGEHGVNIGVLFKKLGKDGRDTDTLLAVMDQLGDLWERGYIYQKIVEVERTEKGVSNSIRWFVTGKGESLPEGFFMPMPG
jgi:hypothetical protein